jgi:hypothetical protein
MPPTKESLVGTWKLVSSKYTNDKGEVRDTNGPNPTGFLTYTADGRVSVVIANSDRKLYSSPPSDAERAEASRTFGAYAGTYTLTGDKVVHHIEISLDPRLVNTNMVRTVTVDGDRITLRGDQASQGRIYGGHSLEVAWERLKPETTRDAR